MKRYISILLCFCLMVGTLTFTQVSAASTGEYKIGDTFESGDFKFEVCTGDEVKVAKYNGSASDVVIPSEVNGYSVTGVGERAFQDCTSLKGIIMPNSIVSIDAYAFSRCSALTNITTSDAITSIGGSAFYNTAYYNNEENWESGALYVGKYLVGTNKSIGSSCSIKEGTKVIADNVFRSTTSKSLESITIPDSVISIGYQAFNGTAYYNNEANWEDGVLYIGNYLIKAKDTISGAYSIKEGTKVIADGAFESCLKSSTNSIAMPSSIKHIGKKAFYSCNLGTSLIIPDGVISIGDDAFRASALENITIPTSVTNIGENALWLYTVNGWPTNILYKGSKEQWSKINNKDVNLQEGGDLYKYIQYLVEPDSRTKVSSVTATSDIADILKYGAETKNPTFTTDSEFATISFGSSNSYIWQKKDGESWVFYDTFYNKVFDEGTYRFKAAVRIKDDKLSTHVIDRAGVMVTIDGVKWTTDENVVIATDRSYVHIYSPEFVVTKSGAQTTQPAQPSVPSTGSGDPTTTNPPSHTHNLILVPTVVSTINTEGKLTYYKCDCGKYYEDALGTVEIEDINTWGILPKCTVRIDGVAVENKGSEFTFPASTEKGFIAYTDGTNYYDVNDTIPSDRVLPNEDLDFTTIAIGEVKMLEGASIRLSERSGIRFETQVDVDKISALPTNAVVEKGTLIALEEIANNELTLDSTYQTVNVKYTSNSYRENGTFAGSIVNIQEHNIAKEFLGRGYVTVTVGDITKTIYADYADGKIANNTRSVAVVALAYKQKASDLYNKLESAHKELVDKWASKVVIL